VRISDTAAGSSAVDTLDLLSKDQMQGRLLDELWKAHFVDANVSRTIESMLANEDPALIRLLCNKTKGVTRSEVRASLKRAKIRIDFPVLAIVGGTALISVTEAKREKDSEPGRARRQPDSPASQITIGHLVQAGLIRPPLRIERLYKEVHLSAVVREDGRSEFDGQLYDSLSTAAGMARKSVVGAPAGHPFPQTNGWTFWMYSDDGVLREID
jgi:Restriction Enzyme Adenine Methylase Associated